MWKIASGKGGGALLPSPCSIAHLLKITVSSWSFSASHANRLPLFFFSFSFGFLNQIQLVTQVLGPGRTSFRRKEKATEFHKADCFQAGWPAHLYSLHGPKRGSVWKLAAAGAGSLRREDGSVGGKEGGKERGNGERGEREKRIRCLGVISFNLLHAAENSSCLPNFLQMKGACPSLLARQGWGLQPGSAHLSKLLDEL